MQIVISKRVLARRDDDRARRADDRRPRRGGGARAGMQNLSSSPADVVVDAESGAGDRSGVRRARLAQADLGADPERGGASGNDGGVFLDGPQPLKLAGRRRAREHRRRRRRSRPSTLPGKDQMLGTGDDQTLTLSQLHAGDRDRRRAERERPAAIDHRDDDVPERPDDAHVHADDVHLVVRIRDRPCPSIITRTRLHAHRAAGRDRPSCCS